MADTPPKDIDFDELHNAVNALMDQAQKNKSTKKTTSDLPKQPATPKPPKEDTASDDSASDDRVAVTVKRPLPQLMTHRRTRGRAMDVVGPRAAPTVTPPSAQPKREAANLQPTKPVEPEPIAPIAQPQASEEPVPSDKELSDDVLASLNLQDAPAQPATGPTMTHQQSEWPDPLEVAGVVNEKPAEDELDAAEPIKLDALEQAPTVEPELGDSDQTEDDSDKPDEATQTPFVTTKVEKRPLGAYTDAPTDKLSANTSEKADAPGPSPAQSQPEELSPAVVAVESAEPEFQATAPPSQDEDTRLDDLRNMAIPQQYKDNEKAASTQSRPVFDTKEYHPAIKAHTGAGHSGSPLRGWFMGITLLVLLVAALGVAYYLITGSLDFSALLKG